MLSNDVSEIFFYTDSDLLCHWQHTHEKIDEPWRQNLGKVLRIDHCIPYFPYKCMKWKTKKTTCVFLYIKYSKFWSVSLEDFVERKPLISEEWKRRWAIKKTINIYLDKLVELATMSSLRIFAISHLIFIKK